MDLKVTQRLRDNQTLLDWIWGQAGYTPETLQLSMLGSTDPLSHHIFRHAHNTHWHSLTYTGEHSSWVQVMPARRRWSTHLGTLTLPRWLSKIKFTTTTFLFNQYHTTSSVSSHGLTWLLSAGYSSQKYRNPPLFMRNEIFPKDKNRTWYLATPCPCFAVMSLPETRYGHPLANWRSHHQEEKEGYLAA